jgi:hypothetical protein
MTNRHGGPNAERATRAEVGGEGKFVVASAVVCFSLIVHTQSRLKTRKEVHFEVIACREMFSLECSSIYTSAKLDSS